MSTATRWVIGVVAALAIVLLIAYARGYVHHHGDEIGSLGISGTVTGY